MDTDLILTLGIVGLVLSLPTLLGGWAEGRVSRLGLVLAMAAAGLIGWAIHSAPIAYRVEEIPNVLLGVLARLLN